MEKKLLEKSEMFVLIKNELELNSKMGILLTVEGRESTPEYIAQLCAFCEDSNYMRDYIIDENGNIIEIGFNEVRII